MSSALVLAAAAPVFMTFVCTSVSPERASSPYIASFKVDGSRLRDIVILWPNGSQSRRRWNGGLLDSGFYLRSRKGLLSDSIAIAWDATQPESATLTHQSMVLSSDFNVDEPVAANCTVRTAEVMESQ